MKKWKEFTQNLRLLWAVIRQRLSVSLIERSMVKLMYQRKWKTDSSEVTELMSFECMSRSTRLFRVNIRMREDLKEGEQKIARMHRKSWLAVFNTATSQLQEVAGERVCTFYPEQQRVYLDGREFNLADATGWDMYVVNLN